MALKLPPGKVPYRVKIPKNPGSTVGKVKMRMPSPGPSPAAVQIKSPRVPKMPKVGY